MLLNQTLEITLDDVQPLSIHGSVYYDLTFQVNHHPQRVRVNPEAFYSDPKIGDRVSIDYVMGQIMSARKLA